MGPQLERPLAPGSSRFPARGQSTLDCLSKRTSPLERLYKNRDRLEASPKEAYEIHDVKRRAGRESHPARTQGCEGV
jgi:hypothetical protein